ncbi:hypothetical protein BC938DRAFT_472751, partial [Jimgerdemannia flammicorona]
VTRDRRVSLSPAPLPPNISPHLSHIPHTSTPLLNTLKRFEMNSASQLSRPQNREMLFKNLNMDKGLTVEGEPALFPCIRLKSNPPEFQAKTDYLNDELTCPSGWTQKLVINGFNKASVKGQFPMVSSDVSGASGSKHRSSAIGFEKSYYRIRYYSKGLVQLNRKIFEPTEDFERNLRDALAEPNPLAIYERLKKVWDRFGYVISEKISIGGKIILWETFRDSQNDTDSIRLAKANMAVAWDQLVAGSEVKVNVGTTLSLPATFSIRQSQGMIIGGDPTSSGFLHGLQSWDDSLIRDVHSWKVIKREGIIPIYEFLSDELRDPIRNVMNIVINLQRILPNTVLKVHSRNTKNNLAWQNFYYAQSTNYTGMVVCTSPPQLNTSIDNSSWNFVPSTTPFTSPSIDSQADSPDVYLRYNDVIYIQPVNHQPEDPRTSSPLPLHNPQYLHGSRNYGSPVTKTALECSLRLFKGEVANEADQWVIEHVDDESWNFFVSDYVLKTDRFRLRHHVIDKHYLCSHNVTIDKANVRMKPKDLNIRLLGGSEAAGVLAREYYEVLLLTTEECMDQKDEWEFVQIK